MTYLIYNISVVYWQAARAFMCDEIWAPILPSLHKVASALTESNDSDVAWRAQVTLALIKGLVACGKDNEASAALDTLYKSLRGSPTELLEQIAHMQLMLGVKPEAITRLKIRSISAVNSIIFQVQAGLVSGDKVGSMLQEAKEMLLTYKGVKEEQDMRLPTWNDALDGPVRVDALSALVSLGRAGLSAGWVKEAQDYAIQVMKASNAGPASIRAEFLMAEVQLHKLGPSLSKAAVDMRVSLLDRMLLALTKSLRLDDKGVAKEGGVLIWNALLPLLTPSLAVFAKRYLLGLTSAFERISSTLFDLRCQAHMELAKLAYREGLLDTFGAQLALAAAMDIHGVSKTELNHLQSIYEGCRAEGFASEDMAPSVRARVFLEKALSSATKGSACRSWFVKAGACLLPEVFGTDIMPTQLLKAKKTNADLAVKGTAHVPDALEIEDFEKNALGHDDNSTENSATISSSPLSEDKAVRLSRWLAFKNIAEAVKASSPSESTVHFFIDMARGARKKGVWDVARAAVECVLQIWQLESLYLPSSPAATQDRPISALPTQSSAAGSRSGPAAVKKTMSIKADGEPIPIQLTDVDRAHLRIVAELQVIRSESIIQLLKEDGLRYDEPFVDIAIANAQGNVKAKPVGLTDPVSLSNSKGQIKPSGVLVPPSVLPHHGPHATGHGLGSVNSNLGHGSDQLDRIVSTSNKLDQDIVTFAVPEAHTSGTTDLDKSNKNDPKHSNDQTYSKNLPLPLHPLQDLDWKELAGMVAFEAHKGFVGSARIGKTLNEPYLAINSAIQVWNHSLHGHSRIREISTTMVETITLVQDVLGELMKRQGKLIDPLCVCMYSRFTTALAGNTIAKKEKADAQVIVVQAEIAAAEAAAAAAASFGAQTESQDSEPVGGSKRTEESKAKKAPKKPGKGDDAVDKINAILFPLPELQRTLENVDFAIESIGLIDCTILSELVQQRVVLQRFLGGKTPDFLLNKDPITRALFLVELTTASPYPSASPPCPGQHTQNLTQPLSGTIPTKNSSSTTNQTQANAAIVFPTLSDAMQALLSIDKDLPSRPISTIEEAVSQNTRSRNISSALPLNSAGGGTHGPPSATVHGAGSGTSSARAPSAGLQDTTRPSATAATSASAPSPSGIPSTVASYTSTLSSTTQVSGKQDTMNLASANTAFASAAAATSTSTVNVNTNTAPKPKAPVWLVMQLWIRVGCAGYEAHQFDMAKQCAQMVLDLLKTKNTQPPRRGPAPARPVEDYHSAHAAHCLLGLSLEFQYSSMLNASSDKDAKDYVEHVLGEAIKEFATASEEGFKAGSLDMVAQAATHLWNISTKLDRQVHLLVDPLEQSLWHFATLATDANAMAGGKKPPTISSTLPVSSSSSSSTTMADLQSSATGSKLAYADLRGRLYELFCKYCLQTQRWEQGLKGIDHAIKSLPEKYTRHLLGYRLIFRARFGLGVSLDMLRLSSKAADKKAAILKVLASTESSISERISALQQAAKLLEGEGMHRLTEQVSCLSVIVSTMLRITEEKTVGGNVQEILQCLDTISTLLRSGLGLVHNDLPSVYGSMERFIEDSKDGADSITIRDSAPRSEVEIDVAAEPDNESSASPGRRNTRATSLVTSIWDGEGGSESNPVAIEMGTQSPTSSSSSYHSQPNGLTEASASANQQVSSNAEGRVRAPSSTTTGGVARLSVSVRPKGSSRDKNKGKDKERDSARVAPPVQSASEGGFRASPVAPVFEKEKAISQITSLELLARHYVMKALVLLSDDLVQSFQEGISSLLHAAAAYAQVGLILHSTPSSASMKLADIRDWLYAPDPSSSLENLDGLQSISHPTEAVYYAFKAVQLLLENFHAAAALPCIHFLRAFASSGKRKSSSKECKGIYI